MKNPPKMAESSRKRKTQTSSRRRCDVAANQADEIIPPLLPQRLYSTITQYERYSSKFCNRDIIEPRFLAEFIAEQNFEFYDILDNLGLLPFLCHHQCYYSELVRVFYSNLQITAEGVIITEVKKIPIRMDIDMFYRITKLVTQSVCFEGNMLEEWRDDHSTHNAKSMIFRENVNIGGRILTGQMKVETCILYYIICRCLLPSNN